MSWSAVNRLPVYLLLSASVLLGTHPLFAQEEPEPTADPKQEEEKERTKPPSLDELLGLEVEETTAESASTSSEEIEDPLEQRRKEALEARLKEQTLAQNLVAAVDDMEVAAKMLGEAKDPGVSLQRLQLEIIRRLDAVIEEAQRQQQSSSSSSSSSQQQQQQQQQQQVPQRSEEQQQQEGQQQQPAPSNQSGEQQPPTRQEADLQAMFEESSVEWGELPERLRDMIRQGMRESVSRMYRRMTEEYYRRIAEEASE